MSSKHTKGPWLVALDASHPAEYAIDAVVDGVTKHIALVHVVGSDDETEANAKVLAAAPELLAAAKRSLNWLSSYQGGAALGMYDQMRAAIAKAT